jgi:PAS domain S-box-containing protein
MVFVKTSGLIYDLKGNRNNAPTKRHKFIQGRWQMKDVAKEPEQLDEEIARLRLQISELQASEAKRRNVEEELRSSEAKYRALVDNANEIIVVIQDNMSKFSNLKAVEITGYSQEELTSRPFVEFIHPDDRKTALENYSRRLGGDKSAPILPLRILDKCGNVKWTEYSWSQLIWEGRPALLYLINDITEWKKMEEALRESEAKYRELAESITDVFFALDENLRYTYWNKASEELTGITAKDALGKHLYDIFPDSESTRKAESAYRRALTIKKPQHLLNNFPIRGRDFVFEINAYPTSAGLCVYVRDVTQHRKLEAALKESEQWYRLIFDNTPIGIGFATLEGRVVTLNKAMESITGYSAEEFNNVNVLDMYADKADREEFLEELNRHGNAVDYPVRLKRKDGACYDALMTSKLTVIGDKKFVQTILHDVTERKRAEEALRESEERYRALVELSPEAIFVASEGKHVFTNSAGLRLLGASSSDQIIGKPVMDVIHPDYRGNVTERIIRSIETGIEAPVIEEKLIRLDGMEIDVEVRAAPLIYQGKPAMQAVIRDISERKQAQEVLRLSEQNFRDSIEKSPLGIRITDADGKTLYANRSYLDIYGYNSIEELEAIPSKQRYTADSFIERDERIRRRKQGQRVPDNYEISIVRKDGQIRNLIVSRAEVLWNGEKRFQVVYQDITERKRAEAELRTKDYAIASSVSGILLLDLDGFVLYANKAYLDLWLYTDAEEAVGHNITEIAANKELARRLLTSVRSRGAWRGELTAVRRDGTARDILLSASLVRDEKGVPVAIIGSVMDITERKRAEEQLQQEKDRAQQYLDVAGAILVANDIDGRVSMINRKGCEVLGYEQKEMIGKNWFNTLIPVRRRREVKEAFNKLMAGEVEPIEYFENPVLTKNGEERMIAWHNVILKDSAGNIIGTLSSGEDITERKKSEEALRSSEARYRLLAENVRDVIWSTDMDLRFTYVSPSVQYLGGRIAEEVMSMSLGQLLTPSSKELAMKTFAEELVMANIEPYDPTRARTLEVEFVRRDDSILWAELKMNFMRDPDGKPVGILGVMRDITERRKSEEEKRSLEQKAQLASRLASVGELASGVAHEINNPLTGVIGYAELLMQEDVPEHIKNDLEIIHDGAQRVAGIVKGLLKFARQTRPERLPVNINEIIEVALRLRAYELETNNIKFVTNLAPELPLTIADPGQLQQVFLNLIVNAETEMKLAHGKGTLTIKTEHTSNAIKISFKDNGPGIAKKNLEKIFDPFFTTREVGEGTGLGLSICYSIVSEHGGKIYAESRPGRGATFVVELPVVLEKKRSAKRSKSTGTPKVRAKANILIVDDEPVVRQLLSQILQEEGHKVETTDDGNEALNRIKKNGYNLILLDIKLPGLSGSKLYEHIREISLSLSKRVVFITGDVMAADTESFLSRTKVPFIAKPFNVKQLKAEINRLLTTHRPRKTFKSKIGKSRS